MIHSILSTTFHFKTAFGQAVIRTQNLYIIMYTASLVPGVDQTGDD